MCMEDGTLHRFRCTRPILATGGYGRAYFAPRSRTRAPGDGNGDGGARGLAAAGPRVRAVPPDGHLRRRVPHHRGRARRGRDPAQQRGRAVHGALRADGEGPRVARRRVAVDDDGDLARGAACGPEKDHIYLTSTTSRPRSSPSGCPGISETAAIFAGVDVTKEPIPVIPTVHYNMGGDPDQPHGRVPRPTARTEPGRRRARPARRRRGASALGARRQPPRRQLAAGHRRLRPRVRQHGRGDAASPAKPHRDARGRGEHAIAQPGQRAHASGRTPTARAQGDAARACRTTRPCSATQARRSRRGAQDRRGGVTAGGPRRHGPHRSSGTRTSSRRSSCTT